MYRVPRIVPSVAQKAIWKVLTWRRYIRNCGLHSQSGSMLVSASSEFVKKGSSSCVNAAVEPGMTSRPSPASIPKNPHQQNPVRKIDVSCPPRRYCSRGCSSNTAWAIACAPSKFKNIVRVEISREER